MNTVSGGDGGDTLSVDGWTRMMLSPFVQEGIVCAAYRVPVGGDGGEVGMASYLVYITGAPLHHEVLHALGMVVAARTGVVFHARFAEGDELPPPGAVPLFRVQSVQARPPPVQPMPRLRPVPRKET